MSRSWIDRMRSWAAPRAVAGIALGRDRVAAALVARTAAGPKLEMLNESRIAATLFEGVPGEDTVAALADALGEIASGFAGRHLPVMLALPDPAVAASVLEFESLPRSERARRDLLAWRLSQESGASSIECVGQEIGRDGGRRHLLAIGADARWLDCIASACRRARVRPWGMRSHALSVFNRYYDELAIDTARDRATGGALLVSTPESWSALLWDGAMRLRHAHMRWRRRQGRGDDPAAVAAEMERLILAYVAADPDRSVGRVHALMAAGEEEVIAALDRRLREPCARLRADEGFDARSSFPPFINSSAALALAAAFDS